MSSKKSPVILATIIAIVLFFLFFSPTDNLGSEGITVDFGLHGSLTSSEYTITKGDSLTYEDSLSRFSFKYPKEFTVGNFGDQETGETVLLQRKGEQAGFQIFINLFDEPGRVLTPQRIHEEIPSIQIIDPREISFEGKVIGISFLTKDESFGTSREIWIAKNGFIYQMSTYESEQNLLAEVLSSWRFE